MKDPSLYRCTAGKEEMCASATSVLTHTSETDMCLLMKYKTAVLMQIANKQNVQSEVAGRNNSGFCRR